MNWIITVRNKAGFKTMAGYTHKTEQQIKEIVASLESDGTLEVIKVSRRDG